MELTYSRRTRGRGSAVQRPPDALSAATDDEKLYAEMFEEHISAVWNYAYRLTGSWAAAEDVASNAFIIAWRKRDTVDLHQRDPRPWLFAVAANLARTEFRSRGRLRRALVRLGGPEQQQDHADAVISSVDADARVQRILMAVHALPRAQRKVVELCLLGELDTGQAAHALGIAEASVRSNLSRARSKLRDVLKEDQS